MNVEHANCKCTKCGMLASSKCPHCRSIFPCGDDAEWANVMNQIMTVTKGSWKEKKMDSDDGRDLVVTFTLLDGETIEDAFHRMVDGLKRCTEQTLKFALCCHHFEFLPGKKSSIGCGHGAKDAQ